MPWSSKQLDSFSADEGNSLVNVNDGYSVLDFMYAYLQKHRLAPTDAKVRNVTSALARYQGPALVTGSALEAFLADRLSQSGG